MERPKCRRKGCNKLINGTHNIGGGWGRHYCSFDCGRKDYEEGKTPQETCDMTWGEFKKEIEAQNIQDDAKIYWINVRCPNKEYSTFIVKKTETNNGYLIES